MASASCAKLLRAFLDKAFVASSTLSFNDGSSDRTAGAPASRERLNKPLCVPFAFSNKGSQVVVYELEQVYDRSLASDRRLVYA